MEDIRQLELELLVECHDDFVGLWSFPWSVREEFGYESDQVVRDTALRIIRSLLEQGLIRAGDLNEEKGGLDFWHLDASQTLSRISSEWKDLGRDPSITEIAWFTTTQKGDGRVRKYLLESQEK